MCLLAVVVSCYPIVAVLGEVSAQERQLLLWSMAMVGELKTHRSQVELTSVGFARNMVLLVGRKS